MRHLLVSLLLVPTVATASGFYLTENGGRALLMGGAFTGQADDLSAIQHNPAGLAQLRGFNFLVDGQLVLHDIAFSRIDPGFDVNNPPKPPGDVVHNQGGPFAVPMLGLGYTFSVFGRPLFVGGGIYGPPADGHYSFPSPNYEQQGGKFIENPRKFAPQRYSLIDNNVVVIYPSLSLAFAPVSAFSLGVSLQPVITSFHLSQSITSIDRIGIHPKTQAQEDPFYDSKVTVDMPLQYSQFTAVFGVLVRPTSWLQIGASFRPQVMINAPGKLKVEPGPAAKALMTTTQGDEATLSMQLPAEAKIGIHLQPNWRLGINFDFVYQGWQSISEIVLDPTNVYLVDPMHAEPQKVAGFRIQKHWQNAYMARLGGSFSLFPWLTAYLGGWYETGAIPDQYIGVDFLHFSRVFFTGGVGVKAFGLELVVGAAGTPESSHAIAASEVRAGSTEPDPAPIIGTGVYTSSAFMFSVGLRGSFGGAALGGMRKMGEPPVEPAVAPAPVEAPAAAPAPATEPAPAPTETPKS